MSVFYSRASVAGHSRPALASPSWMNTSNTEPDLRAVVVAAVVAMAGTAVACTADCGGSSCRWVRGRCTRDRVQLAWVRCHSSPPCPCRP